MKNKKNTWEELSKKRNGVHEKATFTKQEKVTFQYKNNIILLEGYMTIVGNTPIVNTRIRTIFKNPHQLNFKIYHEGFFSSIGKMLGMQDILIGDDEFDQRFVVKSNDEKKIKQLLNDYKLKSLLLFGKPITIETKLKDKCLKSSDESILSYEATGIIKDLDTLENILNIFERFIECMIEIGFSDESQITSVLKS
ncbi:hypothetical protein [Fusibacter ferrireducens]|uniref:DUF3137 domain-containing protein n=1 Tax=Fusibacter ferrireducens TaxID=2785058 RepID=A0ABR9ZT59_9FIRM|nr:hypothetical protein [Fusibacter ferrireducens]MBF4693644.1 hypothetical protein [Fusibacter ferrireducens]